MVLGATIVSLATTFPELTVSLCASIQGHTTMSLGNAIGSIICNTGLALGLVALIKPFKITKDVFNSKAILLMIATITLIVLCFDGKINKFDSIILLVVLCIYMYSNYRSVPKTKMRTEVVSNKFNSKLEPLKLAMLFLIGITMMIVGSKLLVNNGVIIAGAIGIPQAVISLTVIALGTSLPELVSCLTAIKKNHNAISVGNILGANILNIVSSGKIEKYHVIIPGMKGYICPECAANNHYFLLYQHVSKDERLSNIDKSDLSEKIVQLYEKNNGNPVILKFDLK